MNTSVFNNFSKLKLSILYFPIFLLLIIILYLYFNDALNVKGYVEIQTNYFYFINKFLGRFPSVEYNLTQFGDALIFFSFLFILIIYIPSVWESLFSASLVALFFSKVLKDLFRIPRPIEVLDNDSFIIVGREMWGFSSLPSGHSITIFNILTVLLFAFIPKKSSCKMMWIFSIITIGLFIAFTRVGIGAHYPLDVIIGSILGYICAVIGVIISRKYKVWLWINNRKYYPVFIFAILICCVTIILKIINENLIIFYLALISLFVSLYKFIYVYIKK